MSTISSVIRASEVRRARCIVPLITRALFQKLSGTNVPLRNHAPTDGVAHSPRPQAPASEISHVIRLLDNSTTATNVAIPTSRFQCLKDMRGNYVRDCWETVTLTSFSRSQSRGTACEIVEKPPHNDVQQPQRTPRPQPDNRPRPHPSLAPEISHAIRLLDTSTTATNVAIPASRFQCLKDMRGNYVRDCWETMTLTSFSRSQSRGTACKIVGKPRHNDRRHRSPPNTQRSRDRKTGHGLTPASPRKFRT